MSSAFIKGDLVIFVTCKGSVGLMICIYTEPRRRKQQQQQKQQHVSRLKKSCTLNVNRRMVRNYGFYVSRGGDGGGGGAMVVKRRIYFGRASRSFRRRVASERRKQKLLFDRAIRDDDPHATSLRRVARPRRSTPSEASMSTTGTGGDGGGGVDDDGSDCGGSGSSGVPPVDNRVRFSVRSRSIASRTGRRARTPSLPLSHASASPSPPPSSPPPQPPPIQLCVVSTAVPSVCVAPPVPIATKQTYNKQ